MTVTYSLAPEVFTIAAPLIAQHHKHLIDHGHVKIVYVFRSEAAKTGDMEVWGKARKIGGLNAFLALGDEAASGLPDDDTPEVESFFVMEIAADVWKVLDGRQKRALVDHELSHLSMKENESTGEWSLTLRPHDLEEFASVVERNGAWRESITDLLAAAKRSQLSLDLHGERSVDVETGAIVDAERSSADDEPVEASNITPLRRVRERSGS